MGTRHQRTARRCSGGRAGAATGLLLAAVGCGGCFGLEIAPGSLACSTTAARPCPNSMRCIPDRAAGTEGHCYPAEARPPDAAADVLADDAVTDTGVDAPAPDARRDEGAADAASDADAAVVHRLNGPVVFGAETKLSTPFQLVSVSSLIVDPLNPGIFWVAPSSGASDDWVGAFDINGKKVVERPLTGHADPNTDFEDGWSGPSPSGMAIHFADALPAGGKIIRFPIPKVSVGQTADTTDLKPEYIHYTLSGGPGGLNQDTEAWAMDPFSGTVWKFNKWGGAWDDTVFNDTYKAEHFDQLADGATAVFTYVGRTINGYVSLTNAGSNGGVLTRAAFSHSHGDADGSFLFMAGNYFEAMCWIREPGQRWEDVWAAQPIAPYVFTFTGHGSEAADFAPDGSAIYSHSEGTDFRKVEITSLGQ